jgi:oxygen-independent coproporphyrinogen-3 oxidase
LPFCAAKCRYCDFFSVASDGQDIEGMLEAILVEAQHWAPRDPRTVFLGGGTPSLLSQAQLRKFLDRLDALTNFRASASEVTAECNPESLDRDKAALLLDLGVRRLSIGFQSLSQETLELFGRVHSVDDSFRAFAAARAAGVSELNIDLIYAYPGQTLEQWDQDLTRVLALGPDHLSAYNLTFEEETTFKRWLDQGRIEKADEDLELALFERVRERTRNAGLEAYEISNYALNGSQCVHNVNYWHNGPYLGIGPSAVSKIGGVRRGNTKAISGYTRQIRSQSQAVQWQERPSARARLGETWWLGLRLLEGVDPERARRSSGLDPSSEDPALAIAARLEQQGLLRREQQRFCLRERGIPLADYVGREFLELGLGESSAPNANPARD